MGNKFERRLLTSERIFTTKAERASVRLWWRRMDSLFCGKATGRQTVHRTVYLDGPFESTSNKNTDHSNRSSVFLPGGSIPDSFVFESESQPSQAVVIWKGGATE